MVKSFTLELNSQFSEIEKIPGLIDQIDQQLRLGEDLKQRVTLTLSEATTNAVMHGNRENKKKRVFISIHATEHTLVVTVEDEGRGFNPDSIPDPVETENILKTGGRGLFLMEQFCDDVTYSSGGRKVKLTFNR